MNNFQELQNKYPQAAEAIKEVAEQAVLKAEATGADGPEKAEAARDAIIETMKATYDGADMFFDFPGPVDYLVKNALIPMLPGLIDWVVDLFNQNGVFQHGGQK